MTEVSPEALAAGATPEDDTFSIAAKITQQGTVVRTLKKEQAGSESIQTEVAKLQALRAHLAILESANAPADVFDRISFDQLILRKMYLVPSFEIHNGPAGLFDLGPLACTLKANMLNLWRKHFVVEENMLEMECTNLTPHQVLQTSGHVERFTDFMVRDSVTNECFRADKLLEDAIDALFAANPYMPKEERDAHEIVQRQADAFSAEELGNMLKKYNVKSPANPENDVTDPFPFNLMFKTMIGPDGKTVGYLRPETSQGLFVNFRRLLDFNATKMPFSAAQIGLGFRNEISPRSGLLRVREFCMAEIEHFVNPNNKLHPKFDAVRNKTLSLFSADAQLSTGRTLETTIGEAVDSGMVNNQTLGYFMARTQIWLELIGVNPAKMRFRQHLKTEMAHYASDCWDMEIHLSYGWTECVGHADRACYDLQQHGTATNNSMMASEVLPEAIVVETFVAEPNKKLIGPRFKGDQKKVIQALEALQGDEVTALQTILTEKGEADVGGFNITAELVTFKADKKNVMEHKYVPSVIEPSFGIGRVLYAVLEHAFSIRNADEARTVMAFKPCVAPIKVGVFRLTGSPALDTMVNQVNEMLRSRDIVTKVDATSATIGRRYARADELGIPFGVTIDFESLLDNSVTVRDRDSTAQVRIPIPLLPGIIMALTSESTSFTELRDMYPLVKESDDAEDGDAVKKVQKEEPALVIENCKRAMFMRPNTKAK